MAVILNDGQEVSDAHTLMAELSANGGSRSANRPLLASSNGSISRPELAARFKGKQCLDYSTMKIRSDRHATKCVPSRVYSTAWHPRGDSAVLWVGDRWGKLGAWRPLEEDADASVTVLFVHNRAISGLLPLHSDPSLVFTASYDRTVRCLDAVSETSVQCLLWDELLYGVEAQADGRTLFASSARGELLRVDRREGPRAAA